MRTLKLFLVLFVFNNYFNHANSKSVVTDLSDDAEEKSLMEAFSSLLSSSDSEKIVTRSADEVTFTDDEIKEVVDILLKRHPEAAPYLTTDIVKSKIAGISTPAKYLIKFIFDGLRGVKRDVDEERLKSVIEKVMSETSALATAIKEEFANKGQEKAASDDGSAGSASRVLSDSSHNSYISVDSVARVIAKCKNGRMIHNEEITAKKAPIIITNQLNQLQPLARTIIKTLIEKFLNKKGRGGQSNPGSIKTRLDYSPSASMAETESDVQGLELDDSASYAQDSNAAVRSNVQGSGFGNRLNSVGQDYEPNSDPSSNAVASAKSDQVNVDFNKTVGIRLPQTNNTSLSVLSQVLDKIKQTIETVQEVNQEIASEFFGKLFGSTRPSKKGKLLMQAQLPVQDKRFGFIDLGSILKNREKKLNYKATHLPRVPGDKLQNLVEVMKLLVKIVPYCEDIIEAAKKGLPKHAITSLEKLMTEIQNFQKIDKPSKINV